jgi:hypothetical protein
VVRPVEQLEDSLFLQDRRAWKFCRQVPRKGRATHQEDRIGSVTWAQFVAIFSVAATTISNPCSWTPRRRIGVCARDPALPGVSGTGPGDAPVPAIPGLRATREPGILALEVYMVPSYPCVRHNLRARPYEFMGLKGHERHKTINSYVVR